MKKAALAAVAVGATLAAALAAAVVGSGPSAGVASSHRDAPLISEDPSADNTDLYAFRSPDKPGTVTIVSNWIPAEDPAAGPNYYTFSPSAKYKINIDRTGDARPDIVYEFRFGRTAGPAFLGNTVQSWSMWRNKQAVRPREDAAEQHRPALDPELPEPRGKGRRQARTASRSSPASATTRSTATSASIFDLVGVPQGDRRRGRRQGLLRRLRGARDRAADPDLGAAGEEQHDRRLGVDRAPERDRERQAPARLDAGVAARQPARQRGRRPDALQGRVEPLRARSNDKQYAGPVVKPVLAKLMNDLYKLNAPEDEPRRPRRGVRHRRRRASTTPARPSADQLRLNYSIPVTPAGKSTASA